MRPLSAAALVLGWLMLMGAEPWAAEVATPRIAVIVGEASVVEHVSLDEVRELYLRRARLWPNGARAIPINLPADSPTRERFSRTVLGRSPQDLVSYWSARYFEGVTPPAVLPSAAAVLAYVSVEPAAIGYVPVEEVRGGCRVLLVLER